MDSRLLLILLLLLVGAVFKNQLLVSSSGLVLALYLLKVDPVLKYLESSGIELGILVLTVSVLAPLATGRITHKEFLDTFRTTGGMAALAAGILAAYLTGQGVGLLQVAPDVVFGLAFGSIIGTIALRGIPAGPLVAAGFAAVLWKLLGLR